MAINASVISDFSPEKQKNYFKACGSTKDNSNNYIISDVKYTYKCLNFLRQWQSIMCTSIAPKIAYQSLNQLTQCPDAGLWGVSAWLRYSHCTPALLSTRDTSPVANTRTHKMVYTMWALSRHCAILLLLYNTNLIGSDQVKVLPNRGKPNTNQTKHKMCGSTPLRFAVPYISMTRGSHAKPANHFLNQSRGTVLQYIAYVIKPRFEPHFAWIFADYSTHTSKPRHTNITTGLFKFKWASEAGCVCGSVWRVCKCTSLLRGDQSCDPEADTVGSKVN